MGEIGNHLICIKLTSRRTRLFFFKYMKPKNIVLGIVIIVLIIGGVYYLTRSNGPAPMPDQTVAPKSTETANLVPTSANMIEITANGYSQSEIKIKKGDTVTWINKDSVPHWPASAAHPTHRVYPDSDIQKCGTAEQAGIFDACKGLASGESFSFKFDQVGTWKYHDHVKPVAPFFGSVIVE